jgi:hypothetical protein
MNLANELDVLVEQDFPSGTWKRIVKPDQQRYTGWKWAMRIDRVYLLDILKCLFLSAHCCPKVGWVASPPGPIWRQHIVDLGRRLLDATNEASSLLRPGQPRVLIGRPTKSHSSCGTESLPHRAANKIFLDGPYSDTAVARLLARFI